MISQPEYEKECRWIRASIRDWIEEEIKMPLSVVLELLIKQRKRPPAWWGYKEKRGTTHPDDAPMYR
jgi:hypothetical protein